MAAMPVLSNDGEEYFTGRVLRREPAGAEEEGLTTEELALCAAMLDDQCYTFGSVQMDQEDHHNFALESCSRSDPEEFTVPDDASRQHSWRASSHASAHQTTATSSFGNPLADAIRAAHSMEHGAQYNDRRGKHSREGTEKRKAWDVYANSHYRKLQD
eukprot:3424407-Pleurochrysis_carterae.AAC.1